MGRVYEDVKVFGFTLTQIICKRSGDIFKAHANCQYIYYSVCIDGCIKGIQGYWQLVKWSKCEDDDENNCHIHPTHRTVT